MSLIAFILCVLTTFNLATPDRNKKIIKNKISRWLMKKYKVLRMSNTENKFLKR